MEKTSIWADKIEKILRIIFLVFILLILLTALMASQGWIAQEINFMGVLIGGGFCLMLADTANVIYFKRGEKRYWINGICFFIMVGLIALYCAGYFAVLP